MSSSLKKMDLSKMKCDLVFSACFRLSIVILSVSMRFTCKFDIYEHILTYMFTLAESLKVYKKDTCLYIYVYIYIYTYIYIYVYVFKYLKDIR